MNNEGLCIREGLLESILLSFASDKELASKLVLQGGGALHFAYGSPKYSTDLDFAYPALRDSGEIEKMAQKLASGVMTPGGIVIPRIKVVPSEGVPLVRAAYSLGKDKPSGKVEIMGVESFDNSQTKGKYAPLRIESPSEIYVDKIAANLNRMRKRGSIKGTDILDLVYIQRNLSPKVSLDKLNAKARSYNEPESTPEIFRQVAEYIENPANHEMFIQLFNRTLLPDVSRALHFDREYFENAAECFRQFIDGSEERDQERVK